MVGATSNPSGISQVASPGDTEWKALKRVETINPFSNTLEDGYPQNLVQSFQVEETAEFPEGCLISNLR